MLLTNEEKKERKYISGVKYRKANREKIALQKHEAHKANPYPIRKRALEWAKNNRDKCNLASKRWRDSHPEKEIAKMNKRRASRISRTPSWLTEDDFWMMKEAYSLSKLREKLTGIKWNVDHIIPLQGKLVSGLHVPSNLQVIPFIDNMRKGNSFGERS